MGKCKKEITRVQSQQLFERISFSSLSMTTESNLFLWWLQTKLRILTFVTFLVHEQKKLANRRISETKETRPREKTMGSGTTTTTPYATLSDLPRFEKRGHATSAPWMKEQATPHSSRGSNHEPYVPSNSQTAPFATFHNQPLPRQVWILLWKPISLENSFIWTFLWSFLMGFDAAIAAQ
jgi:hypothetical protein